MLTVITFLPLVGIIAILFCNAENAAAVKKTALATAFLNFIFSLRIYFGFNPGTAEMQFSEKAAWIEGFGINYYVGVDGISLFLVLLTTFLTVICILASWNITKRLKEYMISMLFLEVGMVGVFISLDLFLFYVFWEIMLIPMYLIIGIWGGPRRIYAAIKFFLYTMAGSVLMLAAILILVYLNFKVNKEVTFDLIKLHQLDIPVSAQLWLFLAFGIAFAIKVPMFPFHTWLPDAHVEAPTAGSVILAGVLLKMGTYGFIRFCLPLFPYASHQAAFLICSLSVIGIIYGALMALVQSDIKKLVAYSSVSHLGFIVLGIFAFNVSGIKGGVIQMINHGLSTGALFLMVGMIYDRRHTREISEYGGLSQQIPLYSTFFLLVTLSSMALPGLNGFVGEFLILVGAFQYSKVYAGMAVIGVMLGASYLLWTYQRMICNDLTNPENKKLLDLDRREITIMVPVLLFIVWVGIYPKPFLSKINTSVDHLVSQVEEGRQRGKINKKKPQKSFYELLTEKEEKK